MLGKLLKYDFRSVFKEFAYLWPAGLVMALVVRFTMPMMDSDIFGMAIAGSIVSIVYASVLVAVFVVSFLFIIQRFFRGILGQEGYLMHTLPVQPWQLVASKLISAIFVTVVSTVVAMFSVLLLIPGSLVDLFGTPFKALLELFSSGQGYVVLYMVELLILCLVAVASAITELYLAMAIGHLFGRNRIAGSVIAFIGLNIVVNTAMTILISVASQFNISFDPAQWLTAQQAIHLAFLLLILYFLFFAVIYFIGTVLLLKHRLNLE